MPGTFSQLYIQYVFAVKGRQNLIQPSFENDVYSYIAGIIRNKGQKPLAVAGMPDHIHVLVGLKQKFSWQEGYGAFSYSESNYGKVIDYIKNQKQHHEKRSFQQEYTLLLKKFHIEFDEKYLFEFYD